MGKFAGKQKVSWHHPAMFCLKQRPSSKLSQIMFNWDWNWAILLIKRPLFQLLSFSGIPQRPAVAPEPTEANITLLGDMGFPRQQAIDALREAHNDLSTATSILLRNT